MKQMNSTKKWYGIKDDNGRWIAYEIVPSMLKHLKSGVQYCGPFESVAETMIKVNENPEVYTAS